MNQYNTECIQSNHLKSLKQGSTRIRYYSILEGQDRGGWIEGLLLEALVTTQVTGDQGLVGISGGWVKERTREHEMQQVGYDKPCNTVF